MLSLSKHPERSRETYIGTGVLARPAEHNSDTEEGPHTSRKPSENFLCVLGGLSLRTLRF